MNINLLLNAANRSWIIQKIAERLQKELGLLGAKASITEFPDPHAHIVHHMSWAFAAIPTQQPATMLITHLDDLFKLRQVRTTLESHVRVGVCMSSDTMLQLVQHGCATESLCYVSPAHDGLLKPKRIVIGITSRVYPDGRKRESLLRQVAKQMDLSSFEFRIFGRGWEPTNAVLEAAGAKVTYFAESNDYRKDYETLQGVIPTFDYYLYLGMDEGSLGTLDALAAGVPTIITPQGFHLDLPGGITHSVVTAEDLIRVFKEITAPVNIRMASVARLTWAAYACRHLQIWKAITENKPLTQLPDFALQPEKSYAAAQQFRQRSVTFNALSPRRLLSAVSHLRCFRGMRQAIDRFRFRR
jgi:hypothetical protein